MESFSDYVHTAALVLAPSSLYTVREVLAKIRSVSENITSDEDAMRIVWDVCRRFRAAAAAESEAGDDDDQRFIGMTMFEFVNGHVLLSEEERRKPEEFARFFRREIVAIVQKV